MANAVLLLANLALKAAHATRGRGFNAVVARNLGNVRLELDAEHDYFRRSPLMHLVDPLSCPPLPDAGE